MNNNDLLKKTDNLLSEMKQANTNFEQKTSKIILDINEDIDSIEKDFKTTEKELKKFEKGVVNEIDKAVIDFVS